MSAAKSVLRPIGADAAEAVATARYNDLLQAVGPHLPRLAASLAQSGRLSRPELTVIAGYLGKLSRSFEALSLKYHPTGRSDGLRLSIDRAASGFPVAAELHSLASDAVQSIGQRACLPSVAELRQAMLQQILGARSWPFALQYALAQRLYHDLLQQGGLYLARNEVQALWLSATSGRRRYVLSWALYDDEINLPVLYLLEVEDSGVTPLAQDPCRWSALRACVTAQSSNWLKLPTIAQGFVGAVADLAPQALKRLHLGPLQAPAITGQSGPLGEALGEVDAVGLVAVPQNWALLWTLERLPAIGGARDKTGWFSSAERQVFTTDPFAAAAPESGPDTPPETGTTVTERFVLLPDAVHKVLARRSPSGQAAGICFTIGRSGRLRRAQSGTPRLGRHQLGGRK